jgi:hypothetical protein
MEGSHLLWLRADPLIDGYNDTLTDGYALKRKRFALIILGFLRHRQEGLNKRIRDGGTAKV